MAKLPRHRWIVTLSLAVGSAAVAAAAAADAAASADADAGALVGRWVVDLRPTPDADPYFQELVVESVEGGTITGRFYGSPLIDGRVNEDWGTVRWAFATEDGSGRYHTAGELRDGRMVGTTHAIGRGFLSVWTAERAGSEGGADGDPAASDESVGGRNPAAPPESEQFAFLVGDKSCESRQMRPDGTMVDAGSARWEGRWILDGWAIADEWISEQPDGTLFHGVNIRSFNPESRRWDNRWLSSHTLQWKYFWAEKVGDTMVMTGGEGTDPGGAFVDRNVFSEASSDGFHWRKDRSWDGGETWIEGVARIVCRRAG